MDLFENRFSSYGDCLFCGSILCQEDYEAAADSQGDLGWNPYNAFGAAAYSGRIFLINVI